VYPSSGRLQNQSKLGSPGSQIRPAHKWAIFYVIGPLRRKPDIWKRATKSLGPDISSSQAVSDDNTPGCPSESCQKSLSKASRSRASHSENGQFPLCADSSFSRPQSLEIYSAEPLSAYPSHTMKIGHVKGIGEGGVGKAVKCGSEKGGKATQEKNRGRPGATPRQGRHKALARSSAPKRCARQNSRCPSYLIRISSTSENCRLELTHSPFQNTRFPNDYELLEAVDWLGTVHSQKHSRSCTPPVYYVTVRQHPEDCRNAHHLSQLAKLPSHAIGGSTHASLQVLVGS
jgi:hypothetical protein